MNIAFHLVFLIDNIFKGSPFYVFLNLSVSQMLLQNKKEWQVN